MSNALIECVPNFSEGRRPDVIAAIVAPFRETSGCTLLDHRADPDHNRLVVTLAGTPTGLQEALLAAAKIAVARIDLNKHQGGHPRMGAIDVIPFIPLQGATMADCVALAHEFGERFHAETGVPVYFYEEAAKRPHLTRLEQIREGQFEGLRTKIADPRRHPDLGPPQIHPTAGATVIGARRFLIAYNVNLDTDNLEVAKAIAKAIRSSSGGLAQVKAIGLALAERGLVQVSMNITDFEKNPMYRVVEMIRFEARRWGVSIVETEVYGLLPSAALVDAAAYYLQLAEFDHGQVIENRLIEMLARNSHPTS